MEANTGTDYEGFKIPSSIPQDILLIQDLVGPIIPSTQPVTSSESDPVDSIDSSGESTDSVEEVEANLISEDWKATREGISGSDSESSSSGSSSSSDSDSESESEGEVSKKDVQSKIVVDDEDEDEEEGGAAAATTAAFHTKNELSEPDIMIPTIAQVGPDEQLERVGEIMSIVNNVVIVKGVDSGSHRALDRALDCETLLVYEDRRVLGYIHETFGPTYQPMYQVKFNSLFPLNVNDVYVSRPVFHVPTRSKYVFVAELSRLRGSDASNVHDEEPGDHELEFSDDEAEARHRAKLKDRRHSSREPSVPRSPAHVRDQDVDASYGWNPYAEHGVYDMDLDYGPGPSRPVPQPYDDPYSDAYNQPEASPGSATSLPTTPTHPKSEHKPGKATRKSDFGQGQGRDGQYTHHHRERGRGRGRGWSHDRGRGRGRGRGGGSPYGQGREGPAPALPRREEDRGAHAVPRQLSPTSAAIARATRQYPGTSEYTPFVPQLPQFGFAPAYSPSPVQQQQQQFTSPQHSVQPHINPRFAMQFGLNMEMVQQPAQQYLAYTSPYGTPTTPVYEGGWDGQWSQDSGYGAEHVPSHVKEEQDHNS